tara:strand:+ start:207 stop:341 length:135 start_codon:yes stop_codon:yes gene_type:complete
MDYNSGSYINLIFSIKKLSNHKFMYIINLSFIGVEKKWQNLKID